MGPVFRSDKTDAGDKEKEEIEKMGKMDKEQLKDILQWDMKSWSAALRFWESKVDWPRVDTVLELGGKGGGLSLWTALKGKKTVCSDLKNVKATAESLHRKYGVGHLVEYRDVDATDIPYENHFDLVVFKSVIGAVGRMGGIASQQKAFDEIYKALRPGGMLVFAENLTASALHRKLRKRYTSWAGTWRYVTQKELETFLQKYSSCRVKAAGVAGPLGKTEGQRGLLASVDRMVLNHVCPDHWKYIGYGIATK